jgi:hypothetical protein
VPGIASRRTGQRVTPGLDVYGFDGCLIGALVAVSGPDVALEIREPGGELLRVPTSLAGLITREFVMLRGTARELRAWSVDGSRRATV